MGGTCILLVEDEEADVFLLRYAFQKVGVSYPVQVVSDGREALDYLSGSGKFGDRASYPLPRLVLLDLKLPGNSGLEVLEWMRARPAWKNTVVVALTSSNHEADVSRAYDLGVNSYIVKPRDNQRRLEFVRCLNDWWLERNLFASLDEGTARPENS